MNDGVSHGLQHRPCWWAGEAANAAHERLHAGLEDLYLRAEVSHHDVLEMVTGRLENTQPAVLPIPDARQPGRAAAAGPALRTTPLEVHAAVPVKHLALPDVLDRSVLGIWEQLG